MAGPAPTLRLLVLLPALTSAGLARDRAAPSGGPAPPSGPARPSGTARSSGPRLAAGAHHTCVISGDGAVRCWGDDGFGQLGRSPGQAAQPGQPVDLGKGRRASAVFAGTHHTCVILEDGAVKCWGLNSFGQLGLGDTLNRGDGATPMGDALPTVDLGSGARAVALAAGSTATCARLADGRVKCWGEGYDGALGYGDVESRGATPRTMGDHLPAVDLGSRAGVPYPARQIVAVDYHGFCAVVAGASSKTSGLKCWGSNQYCELGIGSRRGSLAGEPGTTGDALPWIDLGRTASGAVRKAVAAASGLQFICVLGDDGAIKCWGDNRAGQLGIGRAGLPRSCDPGETGGAGLVRLPAPAVALGARGLANGGGAHACARLASGGVTCWGENGSGQLGTGDTRPRLRPSAPIDLGRGFVAESLVLGHEHSCAISVDHVVKCWGSNRQGQLGHSLHPGLFPRATPVGDFRLAP